MADMKKVFDNLIIINLYQFILLREKLNNKVNKEAHEEGNEIISIDGIVVGPKNKLPQPPPLDRESSYPDDLVPQASIRHPATPPPPAPATKANVQIYSFKNDYGQREHVGVIFDGSSHGSGPGPQVSNGLGLPNNKGHHVLQHHQHQQAQVGMPWGTRGTRSLRSLAVFPRPIPQSLEFSTPSLPPSPPLFFEFPQKATILTIFLISGCI